MAIRALFHHKLFQFWLIEIAHADREAVLSSLPYFLQRKFYDEVEAHHFQ